jgi:hypothetical protein
MAVNTNKIGDIFIAGVTDAPKAQLKYPPVDAKFDKYVASQRKLFEMIRSGDNSQETEMEYNKILIILESHRESDSVPEKVRKQLCEVYYCLCAKKAGSEICAYHTLNKEI